MGWILAVVFELMREAGLYNAALEERTKAYRTTRYWRGKGVSPSLRDQDKMLKDIRADDPAFGAVAYQVSRGVLMRIDRAFAGFYRRVVAGQSPGFPRFKQVGRWNTLEIPDPYPGWLTRRGNRWQLKVKGLPVIWLTCSQEIGLDWRMTGITLTRRGRCIEVKVTYDAGEVPERCEPRTAVGVDMGVTDAVALSDGTLYPGSKPDLSDIERKQRRLSAAKKGSRQRRARRRILANARRKKRVKDRNWRHRMTTDIVRRADWIAIEDLRLANMTRSARGTLESPGRNVAQKAGLNRVLLEQGHGQTKEQLTYKAEWAGKWLDVVPPHFTSQACHACGVIDEESRNGKVYECRSCGFEDDADVNGASNVLSRSLAGVEVGVRPLPRRLREAA